MSKQCKSVPVADKGSTSEDEEARRRRTRLIARNTQGSMEYPFVNPWGGSARAKQYVPGYVTSFTADVMRARAGAEDNEETGRWDLLVDGFVFLVGKAWYCVRCDVVCVQQRIRGVNTISPCTDRYVETQQCTTYTHAFSPSEKSSRDKDGSRSELHDTTENFTSLSFFSTHVSGYLISLYTTNTQEAVWDEGLGFDALKTLLLLDPST
ncbi:hypothetical protein Tco_0243263 [Tanacetum coccineum]